MLYFDTSYLAPLLLREKSSVRIEKFFLDVQPGDAAVSHWTLVEFSSLLAREVRMGGLDAQIMQMTDQRFLHLVNESFNVLSADIDDFILARGFVQTYKSGLRA
ncbi:MAG: type II toxin-antitoxin system VapC family toxin [Nitrospinota bacterium]|nr:type II toxin-antitoxin system VapC family toxin [Nitrospinota bacterium]